MIEEGLVKEILPFIREITLEFSSREGNTLREQETKYVFYKRVDVPSGDSVIPHHLTKHMPQAEYEARGRPQQYEFFFKPNLTPIPIRPQSNFAV